ncbi:MAG: B12-binding domain-containing radical SAM protein [Promethearchaeota archaeon]
MIKVLLLNPNRSSNYKVDVLPTFPLGLAYLASALRQAGHKSIILDLSVLNVKNHNIMRLVEKIKPDLIGITALSYYYPEMIELCHYIKNYPIVIGGIHVSALPELSLKQTNADYLIIGEGERTIVELANYIENGGDLSKIRGLAYKKNGEIKINKKRELIRNLDEIPFPAWDILNLKLHYSLFRGGYKHFHDYSFYLPLLTSRGCPYKCKYCASTNFWGPSIRFRSVENIIAEIEYDMKHYNVRHFEIWDDNFTLNRKRVIKFCKEIINRGIKASFYLPNGVRADTLSRPLIKLMKLAGFKGLILSPESGSQKILKNVNKTQDINLVRKVAKILQEEGILTSAFFILGLPGETIKTAHQTIKYGSSLPINGIAYLIFTPLPGSELFNEWSQNKNLEKIKWNTNFMGVQNEEKIFSNLTLMQLKKLRSLAYIKYMIRIKNLLRLLKKYNLRKIKPFIESVWRVYLSLFYHIIFRKK